ncbi:MAG: tetratricopeptide repeat protein [Candidatus Obscuribacterales bacterium]|nr:tetratricopeptide repeat protein [Candidatus Obscuribacterales bacterium]
MFANSNQIRVSLLLGLLIGLCTSSAAAKVSNLRKAAICSKQPVNLLKKAQKLVDQKQYQSALLILNQLIARRPRSADAYAERGDVYSFLGKYQKAVQDYTSAIKLAPRWALPLHLRGEAFRQLGEFQKLLADTDAAIKLDPKDVRFYETRASAYADVWQPQKALDDCYTIWNLGHHCNFVNGIAAGAYEELGEYEKAIGFRTKALSFKNTDVFDLGYRARTYELAGMSHLAQADWQNFAKRAKPDELAEMRLCNPLVDFAGTASVNPKEFLNDQLKNGPIILPFHYDDENHIGVPAQVNGHALEIMLDTGCGHSEIWKNAVSEISEVEKFRLRKSKANGEEYFTGFFTSRDMNLGSLSVPKFIFSVGDGLPDHKTMRGFLGGNLLENFVVAIDYSKKQVTLSNTYSSKLSSNAVVVPMLIRLHQPHCAVKLNGKIDAVVLLDTGCAVSTSADSTIRSILPRKYEYNGYISGPWLGKMRRAPVALKSIQIGCVDFGASNVDVFPSHEAPKAANEFILGNNFFRRFKTVVFDYPGRRVIFEPMPPGEMTAAMMFDDARNFLRSNQESKAIELFDKVMKLDSDFIPQCHHYRAVAYRELKDYSKALDDLSALIRMQPDAPMHYLSRAWVYTELEQYKLQVEDSTTAIKLNPKLIDAYELRALGYHELGKMDLSRKDLETAEHLRKIP